MDVGQRGAMSLAERWDERQQGSDGDAGESGGQLERDCVVLCGGCERDKGGECGIFWIEQRDGARGGARTGPAERPNDGREQRLRGERVGVGQRTARAGIARHRWQPGSGGDGGHACWELELGDVVCDCDGQHGGKEESGGVGLGGTDGGRGRSGAGAIERGG